MSFDNVSEKLSEYFVYYAGEEVYYVLLMEQLRLASTRSEFLKAVQTLIRFAKLHVKQSVDVVNQNFLDDLLQFIRTGKKEEVSQFRSSLSNYISVFELEKIRKQERYLLELLR
ncbi:hypothetical protein [Shimazuella kribbensis]|uniref:hypothetical protein n=1 Tax=Shimazuella kribbensis TaxID=139808 RepID=UPI0004189D90|nr:hypothetical protein [Shimazuella kribbensis]